MTPEQAAAVMARLDQLAAEVRDLSDRLEPLEEWADNIARGARERITKDMERQFT